MAGHNQFKNWIGDADKEFDSIIALMQEVHRICNEHGITSGYENPYTSLTNEVVFCCCRTGWFVSLQLCIQPSH